MTTTNETAPAPEKAPAQPMTFDEFIPHMSGRVHALTYQIDLLLDEDSRLRRAISVAAHHIIDTTIHSVGAGLGDYEASVLEVKKIAERIMNQADVTLLPHWEAVATQIRADSAEIRSIARLWRPTTL